jgi:hypothetical protein
MSWLARPGTCTQHILLAAANQQRQAANHFTRKSFQNADGATCPTGNFPVHLDGAQAAQAAYA